MLVTPIPCFMMLNHVPVQLLADMSIFMAVFTVFAILLWLRDRRRSK